MNVRSIGALVGILSLCALASASRPSQGQGFAGLGTDVDGFAQVVPGRPLVFPGDHGPHPEYRIEWWYFTANLSDAEGEHYGVQWTLFRQAMSPDDRGEGWASQQVWMGHAAVTSARTHRFAERFARGGVGQASAEPEPFRAWIDDWQMRSLPNGASHLAPLHVSASAKDFSYELRLESDRPLVLQGDAGYSRKSERGQASYYYSQPWLEVTGSIVIDGKTIEVTGNGWIDREWSSQPLASDQKGWDWFSLHLRSGEKLMLFRLRHAEGRHFFAGSWIDSNGQSVPLPSQGIIMTPTAHTSIGGREVPTSWDIAIPSRGLAISSVPVNPRSWMDTRFKYWEGPVVVTGSHPGMGYLEMTGY